MRRAFVRSCWGYFEGSTFGLAHYVGTVEDLTSSKHDKRPDDGERTLDSLKLTLKWCTSDRLTPGWAPAFGVLGWKAVQKSFVVRNRLMHPKRAETFVVSDEDLTVTRDALLWFTKSMSDILERALKAVEEYKP